MSQSVLAVLADGAERSWADLADALGVARHDATLRAAVRALLADGTLHKRTSGPRSFYALALVPLTEALGPDRAGALLDAGRLACSQCGERAAECVRGVYGHIALCAQCDGSASMAEHARGFGEFPCEVQP